MIISGDCIETTSTGENSNRGKSKTRRSRKKKISSSTRNRASLRTAHAYRICKNLDQVSSEKTIITWKSLISEILKFGTDDLSSLNVALIAKINDNSISERKQYRILCNENDFNAVNTLACKNRCSFTVILKYLKHVFSRESEEKYINDILKPNTVHFSITILNNNFSVENKVKATESSNQVREVKIEAIENCLKSLSKLVDNLDPLKLTKSPIVKTKSSASQTDESSFNLEPNKLKTSSKSSEITTPKIKKSSFKAFFSEIDLKPGDEDNRINKNVNIQKTKKDYNGESASNNFQYGNESIITKTWKIHNNGSKQWPESLKIMRIGGNIDTAYGRDIYKVSNLRPGEEDNFSITFKIPAGIKEEQKFSSFWKFFFEEQLIGKKIRLDVVIKPDYKDSGIDEEHVTNLIALSENSPSELCLSDEGENEEEIIVFPHCFNLDVPFFPPNTYSSLLKTGFDKLSNIESLRSIHLADQKKETENGACVSNFTIDNILKDFPKNKHVASSRIAEESIPLASNSSIIKSDNKNEVPNRSIGRVSASSFIKPPLNSEKNTTAAPEKSCTNENGPKSTTKQAPFQSGTASKNCTSKQWKYQNERLKLPSEQLGNVLLPSVGLVTRTISNICSMITNPGANSNTNGGYGAHAPHTGVHDENGGKQEDDSEAFALALQKLFEMGFCNESLNVELLTKNNFDIQRTVRELLLSVGF